MTKGSRKSEQFYDLKLAVLIFGFALLAYVSPSIWNRYDNIPVIAATDTQSNGPVERPKPEYIVKAYFYQVDSGSFEKAFSLMDPASIRYSKKIWTEDFSNIYFIKLRNLELKSEEEGGKEYTVILDVRLKGKVLKTSWKNGENKRIVALKLVDNQWRVSDIKTP